MVRFKGDETPTRWWEWLFVPIMVPLFLVILMVMCVVSIPLEFVYRVRLNRKENRLQPMLAAVGRYMDWSEVATKLKAGEGTLIIEHLSPKGPTREWWTEDNLKADAPVPLPTSIKSAPTEGTREAVQAYAKSCVCRYVDLDEGVALLTQVPIPRHRRLDPSKYVTVDLGGGLMSAVYLRTDRELSRKYPQAKVVTLLEWSEEPLLFDGDAEDVFLAEENEPRQEVN